MKRIQTLVKERPALRGRLPWIILVAACGIVVPALVGCVAYVHGGFPIVIGSPHDRYYHARPYSGYFCYDCHGYTYFDPYYDYCMHFGFRIDWGHRTPLWRYYNRHHDTIVMRMGHPTYRYKYDYREGPRYKGPVRYEQWRKTEGRTYYSTKQKSTEMEKSTKGKTSTKSKSSTTTKTKSSSGKKSKE